MTNSFVRGGVTGLGLVNLVVGVADLAAIWSARTRSAVALDEGTEQSL
jgi:hypothetical protein